MSGAARAPRRVAVFTSHPIQYQAPLFRELAARPELDATVFFGSRHGLDDAFDAGFGASFRWDVPLLEGYRSVFLENRARRPDVSSFRGVSVPGIAEHWRPGAFDAALVLGWQTLGHLQAMRAARRAGMALFLRGESNLGMRPGSSLKARLRQALWVPVRTRLYREGFARVDGFLTIGTRNAEYYRHFGVDAGRLYPAPYCVDNAQFALPPERRAEARRRVRARIGAGEGDVVFTSAAKLLERKRPLDLLEAFRALDRPDARLVFLGDGPERPALEARIAEHGVAERVAISGFVNQSEIPEWYAASDALVLPSDRMETWGLVVNEAMAAGLPVLVSDAAGCAPDLVREGENGWTFPCGDVPALAERMRRLAELSADKRALMGSRSREVVSRCTVGHVADALVRALDERLPR